MTTFCVGNTKAKKLPDNTAFIGYQWSPKTVSFTLKTANFSDDLSTWAFKYIPASSLQCIGLSSIRQTSCGGNRGKARPEEPPGYNNEVVSSVMSFLSFVTATCESAPVFCQCVPVCLQFLNAVTVSYPFTAQALFQVAGGCCMKESNVSHH